MNESPGELTAANAGDWTAMSDAFLSGCYHEGALSSSIDKIGE